MKKKILIIVSIVCIIILGWLGYEIYAYYNPEYGFKVATPESTTDMYIEHLNFYINEKSIFGAPKEIYVKSAEIVDGAYMIYTEIISKYTAPMNVKVSYTEESGKTAIIYEGIGTDKESGKEEVIRKEKNFDFIVGK